MATSLFIFLNPEAGIMLSSFPRFVNVFYECNIQCFRLEIEPDPPLEPASWVAERICRILGSVKEIVSGKKGFY